jgi:hypothetical protein
METLLLILVLIGDPSGADLGKALAEDIQRRTESAKIVVGAEALAALQERGLSVKDLMVTPNIATHLTGGTPPAPLIVIHVDRSEKGGDSVVETQVWVDGRAERHIAIAGKSADPLSSVSSGVLALIGHRIGINNANAPLDDVELGRLAERGEWLNLLGKLAALEQRSPRQRYYEVLAYVRLGQREPAVEALNALRKEAPDHFLVAAAAELIPALPEPEPAPVAPAPIEDDGSNTLRD